MSSSRSLDLTVVVLTCCVVLRAAPAAAYVDGGSGSLLLQLLLAGIAGASVMVRLYWSRLMQRLGRRPPPAALEDGQAQREPR